MTCQMPLKRIEAISHDTRHPRLDRPKGFDFRPGQEVELPVLKDGWKHKGRRFSPITVPGIFIAGGARGHLLIAVLRTQLQDNATLQDQN